MKYQNSNKSYLSSQIFNIDIRMFNTKEEGMEKKKWFVNE